MLVVPATLLLAWRLDDAYYRRSWGTAKALTDDTLTLFLAAALLFVLGAMLPLIIPRGRARHAVPQTALHDSAALRMACVVLYRLTLVGYVAFALVGFSRGARFSDLVLTLTSQNAFDSTLRDQFAPVAGLTTLTQFGIAYVVAAMVLLTRGRDAYILRRIGVVFALGLVRAFFLTERLAFLELAIPVAALGAMHLAKRGGVVGRLIAAAPFIFLPAVVAIFGLFEYSRSWVYYSQYADRSFAEFVVNRLAGYYATAHNNGALALTYNSGGTRLPYGSVEAFWAAPGISQLDLYQRITGHNQASEYTSVLQQYGNPELNSPGGLSVPLIDYGTYGGLAFLFLAGLGLAVAYRAWLDGALWASLLYPVALTGVFELPRYFYWGQGRVAPAFLGLLLTAWLAGRRRRGPYEVPNSDAWSKSWAVGPRTSAR